MSRPRFCPQWDFQVATPKIQVATSPNATHVATSKMMSRPQTQQNQVVTSKPGRNQPLFSSHNTLVVTQKPWSRRQTSYRQSSQVATSISGRDLKLTRPGRDLKVMSRPQIVFPRSQHEYSCHDPGPFSHNLSQVATPKRMLRR